MSKKLHFERTQIDVISFQRVKLPFDFKRSSVRLVGGNLFLWYETDGYSPVKKFGVYMTEDKSEHDSTLRFIGQISAFGKTIYFFVE